MKLFISLLVIPFCFQVFSQVNSISPLKLNEIMKGNEFIGHQPDHIRWTIDGKSILFEWNPNNEDGNSSYIYSIDQKNIGKQRKTNLLRYL